MIVYCITIVLQYVQDFTLDLLFHQLRLLYSILLCFILHTHMIHPPAFILNSPSILSAWIRTESQSLQGVSVPSSSPSVQQHVHCVESSTQTTVVWKARTSWRLKLFLLIRCGIWLLGNYMMLLYVIDDMNGIHAYTNATRYDMNGFNPGNRRFGDPRTNRSHQIMGDMVI